MRDKCAWCGSTAYKTYRVGFNYYCIQKGECEKRRNNATPDERKRIDTLAKERAKKKN